MRWPKYWSFSFSIIPSKEIPWLTSFRMDWLDLLAVQGTLKSLLQHQWKKEKPNASPKYFSAGFFFPFIIQFWSFYFSSFFFHIKTNCQVYECLRTLSLTWIALWQIKSKHNNFHISFPKVTGQSSMFSMVSTVNIYIHIFVLKQ